MSDEMKNNGQNEPKVETIADKLNSAAQTLIDANAEAKVRKEEEKKQQVLYGKEVEPRRKTVSIAEAVWMIKDNEDLFGDFCKEDLDEE